ncbi:MULTISPECIES: 4-hydroxy-tetrahydrodipicolinate synthase [Desulfococcus]|jgi:4-hydroxy-tetrahydrodipicolinate synthase|uniref:4-hydroxy-tetrahydrodipicolinate synthase n=1 Tax=Desulfococcus multivorans DSM 2059 TaxID=1121405 RepID=S7TWR6_DESML|nr:4-hydroxy-tetrahydrodipicolinate synthase [Desulfococcus multivorans]AOY59593.1 DapA: dihydrodipicolinate synthase [Desulfococcus multivorans]AQV01782.1 4-hydroxy-tetrahydrodipicolinate synthase [Desulfococcus multivorans]EPR41195.1 Dihydrodipicolinate synthase [Desulfococcus multivorans DSM 2059]MDX9819414.1 4-hydroxy-tetrahydrodipicolinate synthase [Desulfococcus multivorans]SKA25278.1 4-hydroxy-tetrahydrodipicolinate synthase [Desulfococcus multivorans DSM 2059]
MMAGTYTALVTPFTGDEIDEDGIERLTEFQIANGVSGVLAVGTTGESPVLNWREHNAVIEKIAKLCRDRCKCIAGTGSNNTLEALEATEHAATAGVDAVLLVDPYYNGPSSLEIRREYVAPIAARFPEIDVIPYVIPGRTGAQLLPEDLALLNQQYPNVSTVKEATGNIENMRRVRSCCGPAFTILSGDDALTLRMMKDPAIKAGGVISVASNIAPKAVSEMVRLLEAGETEAADHLEAGLAPLFRLVTITTTEKTPYGDVACRARNPLGIKTLMHILGMPSGVCRRPLGKMTANGIQVVLEAAREVQARTPEILAPISDFFGIDIENRLNSPDRWEHLFYKEY